MTGETSLGDIHIANEVIAELAGYAASQSYGVVGMAAKSKTQKVVQLLSRDKLARGVDVKNAPDGSLAIDLYVVIEYGTKLAEVAKNLLDRVNHVVTTYAEVPVGSVEVHVQDIEVRE